MRRQIPPLCRFRQIEQKFDTGTGPFNFNSLRSFLPNMPHTFFPDNNGTAGCVYKEATPPEETRTARSRCRLNVGFNPTS